ncbi:exodeoxyribonuclease VII large subunit [Jatrophihabitans sp. GAS493]|uniref:exodeoxyribonuclease VII large subunit n=1 Tax=Jatrophihabitans sp. GAS493 TaxID=1907575 RepID=UPI000BB89865|nr:exodeoxyribonuclease VII large subunit [Jatrophihabitans sp. GAS493]SOD75141.1 exodeoxyribonuclease VII large subunit [Jatrophihabitans sp. GAS493]
MTKLETSAENPVPVRVVAARISEWISRLGEIWVDGQVAQLTRRPGVATHFMTLRDPDANISLSVTCARGVLPETVTEGSRVTIRARPDFYIERGSLSLRATVVRQVGLGELLARLEQLKRLLTAEGVFDSRHKQRLPFLPRRVGLISGRASAAERDVVENARRRFAGTRFEIRSVATQGSSAVTEIIDALEQLDAETEVDVIVITRGGGSIEDLLPFSNEALIRAVVACRTPVVSAIGHETDTPLLDLVADFAASTPTDAAKRIVPDLGEELALVRECRARGRATIRRRLDSEAELMAGLPTRLRATVRHRVSQAATDVEALRQRSERRVDGLIHSARLDLEHVQARVRALSPQATLDRGYAVVQTADGTVVRAAPQAVGELRIRVAAGSFLATPTPSGSGTAAKKSSKGKV